MSSRPILVLTVGLVVFGAVLFTNVNSVYAQTPGEDEANLPEVPYIAEVIGSDVYLRSGAGTAHYYCGKVNTPQRVTVTKHQQGWSEIIPPEGTFSWISKDFVDLGKINPGIGLVNGNGVRVWAGSDYVEPMRSISLQVKLNKGDIVKLIDPGLQKGDYYKIVPPPGAHLWISSKLLKYIGPRPIPKLMITPEPMVDVKPVVPKVEPKPEPTRPPVVEPKPVIEPIIEPEVKPVTEPLPETKVEPKPEDIYPTKVEPVVTEIETPPLPTEAQRVKECYDIAEQIRGELEKPLDAQTFTKFRIALIAILNDPSAGKAQRYAEYQLGQIKRFELARTAGDEIKTQDAELEILLQQIREKRAADIADIPDRGKHIIEGIFKPSLVFTPEVGQIRYKILNDAGRVVCYAVPSGRAARIQLAKFEGKKVGLKGTIVSDKRNPIGLVMFTEIEELAPAATPEL